MHVYANSNGRIAGFFTLSAISLDLSGLPSEFQRGRPRFPLPATLLGRLGVDVEFEGRGLGRLLLGLALTEACAASKIVNSAAIVLDLAPDASERAAKLYRNHGFSELPTNPSRMILMMSAVRRHVDEQSLVP